MRRGNSRSRGGRQTQHVMDQQSPRQSSAVPLMATHLQIQGLKDLDMELELLQRKRQIIEQQQEILNSTYMQRTNYEQPTFSQSHDKRYDDYTRLYDNPRELNSYGGGASNRKRNHIPVWENELPSKRFAAPSRTVKKAFGSRLGPQPNNQSAGFRSGFRSQTAPKPHNSRFSNAAPPQKKKEFCPTKVTKPSAPSPTAKLGSYHPAERKKLVTEALKNSAGSSRGVQRESDDGAWILRVDRTPSRQLNGRLELALGIIIKELKLVKPDFESLFHQPVPMRVMKALVRERIRTAMMGKVAKCVDTIIATYSEMFPSSKDDDVVMKGLEAQKGAEFIIIKAEDPETYFKKNMYRLMSLKLEEMTNKLSEIYCNRNPGVPGEKRFKPYMKQKKQFKDVDAQPETGDGEDKTREGEDKPRDGEDKTGGGDEKTGGGEEKTGGAEEKTGGGEEKTGGGEEKTGDGEEKTGDGEEKTGGVEVKTEGGEDETGDGVLETGDGGPADEVQSKSDDVKADNTTELVEEPATIEAKTNERQISTDDSSVIDKVDPTDATENKAPANSTEPPPYIVNIEQYLAFEKIMTYKLINLLKKFAPALLKIMDVDSMYRRVKANILSETKNKLGIAEEEPNNSPDMRKVNPLQYYVKIIGKPNLPKRKAMEGFFSEFEPKSIKKHRTIHSLLFVGFIDKEPYEKMLAANGTVIGRSTLEIKVSDKYWTPQIGDSSTTVEGDKPAKANLNESNSGSIGSDLDEQISDLLTSIRQSDDQDTFSEDVVMNSPVKTPASATQKENGDQAVEEASAPTDQETVIVDEANDVKFIPENENDVVEVIPENENDVVEVKDVPQVEEANLDNKKADNAAENEASEAKDTVEALKADAKTVPATPTRASTRLAATPGGIRTRRMSKLME